MTHCSINAVRAPQKLHRERVNSRDVEGDFAGIRSSALEPESWYGGGSMVQFGFGSVQSWLVIDRFLPPTFYGRVRGGLFTCL